jgi:hypothetical protein
MDLRADRPRYAQSFQFELLLELFSILSGYSKKVCFCLYCHSGSGPGPPSLLPVSEVKYLAQEAGALNDLLTRLSQFLTRNSRK